MEVNFSSAILFGSDSVSAGIYFPVDKVGVPLKGVNRLEVGIVYESNLSLS